MNKSSPIKIARTAAIVGVCMAVSGLAVCDAADLIIAKLSLAQQSALILSVLTASAIAGIAIEYRISRRHCRQS